jgi:hypothetical protein
MAISVSQTLFLLGFIPMKSSSLFITLFTIVLGADFCFAQKSGILFEQPKNVEAVAEEAFAQTKIDQVSAPVFATCFVGGRLRDGLEERFNGHFSFIGFYARRPGPNGKDQIRTWVSKDAIVNGQFAPFEMNKDYFFDGERWKYRDENMPGLRSVDPEIEGAKNACSNYCIDSRAAIFQYATGMTSHYAIQQYGNWNYYGIELLSVDQRPRSLQATFESSKGYRYFLTLDPKIEYRASHLAVTEKGNHLGDGEANAFVINSVRWGKSKAGHWVGEAGENTQYIGGTKSKHTNACMISWKAAWWFGDDEVPASLFDEKDLQQSRGELLVKFVDEIEAVEAIPDFGLPEWKY